MRACLFASSQLHRFSRQHLGAKPTGSRCVGSFEARTFQMLSPAHDPLDSTLLRSSE